MRMDVFLDLLLGSEREHTTGGNRMSSGHLEDSLNGEFVKGQRDIGTSGMPCDRIASSSGASGLKLPSERMTRRPSDR